MGANKFLETLSLIFQRNENENLTIFTPTNDAWIEYSGSFNKKENEISMISRQESPVQTELSPVSIHHVFPGIVKSGDLLENQTLTSIDNITKVRVNVYEIPKRVVTLNCAPIITANTVATNGIIHVIDRVLPVSNQTIGEIIEENLEYSKFLKLIQKTGLLQKLKSQSGRYTLFAVKNEVMEKLEPSLLKKLESGHSCFDAIAESHVVDKVICSSAIFNQLKVTSLASHSFILKRTYEQKLLVDDVEITGRDIVASNGVIHLINDLIIPEKVKPISKVLEYSVTNEFWKLLNASDRMQEWDSKENVTFFIPTNEALKSFRKRNDLTNRTDDFLGLHVINMILKSDSFYNNEIIETSNGKKMRINLYGDLPEQFTREPFSRATLQCSNIIYQNKEICGGIVHLMDKTIAAPQANLMTALNSSRDFSIFAKLIKIAGLDSKLKDESGPFTILIPKDATINEQISANKLEEYMNDPKKAMKLVQKHIIPDFLCCSGVSQMPLLFSLQQFRTMDGSSISAYRDFEGKIKFGASTVKKCDWLAENGVIHVIDRVLQPRQQTSSVVHPLFHVFIN
ncbi:transforming growth factor-beta-induced protein ig-h3-like isoform X4 [Leptotrombidium deliense]|uniref:Transforming growth factor-beta-induced protein ig-h3-like isoform X4 n=1 Tax=Leptotrombidium deliense TaxID=299467 RepID=A0A443SBW4_9ACAR|nr:transforming growth factor-beta-induced protein ig-h3-like isoform X4 [Leptotrombidium deliense]